VACPCGPEGLARTGCPRWPSLAMKGPRFESARGPRFAGIFGDLVVCFGNSHRTPAEHRGEGIIGSGRCLRSRSPPQRSRTLSPGRRRHSRDLSSRGTGCAISVASRVERRREDVRRAPGQHDRALRDDSGVRGWRSRLHHAVETAGGAERSAIVQLARSRYYRRRDRGALRPHKNPVCSSSAECLKGGPRCGS